MKNIRLTMLKSNILFGYASLLGTMVLALLIILFLSDSITDSNLICLSHCEGAQPSSLDNNYWKIESIKANTWHVLFRNVGVKYEVRQSLSDTDVNTSIFELREIGPNYSGRHDEDFLLSMTEKEILDFWAKNNQGIENLKINGYDLKYLVGSADKKNVFVSKCYNNVIDATMDHFNNIQRGEFHPDLPNKINPNSHGRGINVLDNVKNTFGVHNNNSWPTDNTSKSLNESKDDVHTVAKQTKNIDQIKRDIRSPLDQFIIIDLLIIIIPLLASLQFSFTNMTLYLGISTLTIITIYVLPLLWEKIKTSVWFITTVSILHTVYNFVKSQIQIIKGLNFLPFFTCLFLYILVNNLIGMIPYTFAPTSHFILTFFISFTIVLGCSFLGFILHNLGYFSLLTPKGSPLGLLPLLVLIETISYLARNVSLGLRLAANILSGHMLLHILSEFTYKIMDTDIFHFFIAIIPLMFIGAFSGLELGIAFIQSQVFIVLSSSYTKDSLELH